MVQGDVVQMAENGSGRFNKVADVVVTNPPFGTKSNEGIDMKFLEAAQDSFHEFSIFKGSSYKYHCRFEINVGKRRIRHTTTLKLNDEFLYRPKTN